MAKRKKTSNDLQNTIQKTKDPATHTGVNSGAPVGLAVPASLVTPFHSHLEAGQSFRKLVSCSIPKDFIGSSLIGHLRFDLWHEPQYRVLLDDSRLLDKINGKILHQTSYFDKRLQGFVIWQNVS